MQKALKVSIVFSVLLFLYGCAGWGVLYGKASPCECTAGSGYRVNLSTMTNGTDEKVRIEVVDDRSVSWVYYDYEDRLPGKCTFKVFGQGSKLEIVVADRITFPIQVELDLRTGRFTTIHR